MLYFYEVHDGDEDLGSAVLVCHPERHSPAEFFAIVKRVRLLVMGSFEEPSLSEAIANELQRASGFLHVTDERLIASVNVDERDEETFLVTSEGGTRSVFVSVDEDDEDESDRPN